MPSSHLHGKALLLLPQAAVGPQQALEVLPHVHAPLNVWGPQPGGRAEETVRMLLVPSFDQKSTVLAYGQGWASSRDVNTKWEGPPSTEGPSPGCV